MENVGFRLETPAELAHVLEKRIRYRRAGLSRWVRGGQSAGACKSLAAGSESLAVVLRRRIQVGKTSSWNSAGFPTYSLA